MIKVLFSILFFALSFCLLSQKSDVEDFLNSVAGYYKDDYKVELNYELYRFPDQFTDPIESYSGFILKTDKGSYKKINTTEIIQSEKDKLIIDHKSNAFLYTDVSIDKKTIEALSNKGEVDFSGFLMFCSSYNLDTLSDGDLLCTMILNAKSALPFSMITIKASSKNYAISKVKMLYQSQIDFDKRYDKQDDAYPILVIRYGNKVRVKNSEKEKVVIKNYVSKSIGNRVKLKNFPSYDQVN